MPDDKKELRPIPDTALPRESEPVEVVEQLPAVARGERREASPEALQAQAAEVAEAPVAGQSAAAVDDPVLNDVESILADGLGEVYRTLPPAKQQAFKTRGESIAVQVRVMIAKGKLKVYDILRAIREWLRLIPGVNVFFLEQEAKIKADKLVAYAEQRLSRDG